MRKLLALLTIFASPALAQQPNGTINSPIYATGYISQVGGANVTTKIPPQPNHPTNLNIYTVGAISGTWTIQLPNPAFEGQILSFSCGGSAAAISITSSDGSTVDSNLPTACVGASTFAAQFDQRNNIWRYIGYGNSAGIVPSQLPAFVGGDCTTSAGSVAISCATLKGQANTWALPQTFSAAPIFVTLNGYVVCHGASACTDSAPPLYADLFNIKAANSASTNVTNLNALLAASASYSYRQIVFREHNVPLNADISIPVGINSRVDIVCEGQYTGVQFTGSGVNYGLLFGNPAAAAGTYAYAGSVRHCLVTGDSVAKRGISFVNTQGGGVVGSILRDFNGAALYYRSVLMSHARDNYILSSGKSEPAFIITGDDAADNYSTTFTWDNNIIDGGTAPASSSGMVGLSIDRTIGATIRGGAIQSAGLPIAIDSATSSVAESRLISVEDLDIEAPANGGCFVTVGTGWAGTAGAVANISFKNINGSISGSTDVRCAIQAKNTTALAVGYGVSIQPTGGSIVAFLDLAGTGNVGAMLTNNRSQSGSGYARVSINGAQDKCASPYYDYFQGQCSTFGGQKIISGSTVDGSISVEGGVYSSYYVNNGGATNFTNMTNVPIGVVICLNAANGNTTVKHAAGGAGSFYNSTGADITLAANSVHCYFSSGNDGNLHATQ